MDSIWQASAQDLAGAIRQRRLSSEEVVNSFIDRIEQLDADVNAFALVDAEGARAAARSADAAAKRGDALGPLHGLPVSVKDLVATAGLRTALGSKIYAANIPKVDAQAVARVRRAGGIILGKTTTPELGHKVLTDSPLHGVTRNPWALERTCGGSSGGGAASVAMGFGPLAVVTDGAGSARIPAACCGVVGLKPTLGSVPNEMTPDLFGQLTTIGAMGRTVADVALLYSVMAGPHPQDPWSCGGRHVDQDSHPDNVKGLRVHWMPLFGNSRTDREMMAVVLAAIAKLAECGAEIIPAKSIDPGLDASRILMRANQAARYGHLLRQWRGQMDPSMIDCVEEGLNQTAAELQMAMLERTNLYRRVQQLFETAEVVITPTIGAPPPLASHRAEQQIVINGELAGSLRQAWYCYTIPLNPTGHPALSVPCGWTAGGLPVGLQIIGPWYSELRLLMVAAALETVLPWKDRWPTLAIGRAGVAGA